MIEVIPNWHPIFVHFTVALMSVAGILFLLAHFASNWQYRNEARKVAVWNFWIGSVVTLATVLAGWDAYNTVAHDTPSHAAMTLHRNWAFGTLGVIVILAIWLWKSRRDGTIKLPLPFVIIVTVLLGLLSTTAWHGGEVVYRHGLGVMSLPQSEGDGHAHEHADGQDHSDSLDKQPGSNNAGESHDEHDHSDHAH